MEEVRTELSARDKDLVLSYGEWIFPGITQMAEDVHQNADMKFQVDMKDGSVAILNLSGMSLSFVRFESGTYGFESKEELCRRFGSRLSSMLEGRGWTQSDLADMLGCYQSLISKYIQGEVAPTLYTCVRIADVLGVSLEDLVRLQRVG